MSWRQLMRWQQYFLLEPWGEERADLRVAMLTALMANVNRDSKRHPTPYTAMDFMPFVEKPKLDAAAMFQSWKAGIKSLGKRKADKANRTEQQERRTRQLQPRRRQRVTKGHTV